MKKSTYETRTVLLDAHAIIHRAYHAMPDFSTRDGRPTGGLYGVCTMVLKIIDELKPDHIIACYDLPGPTFRHAAYDDYKAGRSETEDNLKTQLQTSRDIFHAFNIPIYELEGYEADDILGTIAEDLKKDKTHEIIIASGDMDTMQLIEGDQVKVYTLKKGINDTIMYDEEAVVDRYSFGSDLIPDFKGLSGDPSDNIIGIKGIGAKTATTLVTTFGTIENIYQVLKKTPEKFTEAKITPRMIGLLTDGEEDALFSKELATIKCDVPIDFVLNGDDFKTGLDLARAGELFRDLEFRTMMSKLQKVMNIKEVEQDRLGFADESDVDPDDLTAAKLGVYVLNPTISEPTIDDVLRYGETFDEAFKEIKADIKKEGLDFVHQEIEVAVAKPLELVNQTGFTIDKKKLQALGVKFHKLIAKLEKDIHALAGEEFNIKSTKQLSVVLFENMGLPTTGIKKTPKGVLSTKESELEKLAGQHDIIEKILSYRELTKLTSTYIDNIVPMIKSDSRLYATFVSAGTTTGRMSSRDPNLQNIPVGGDYGKEIRTVFVPTDGYTLLACDYSQIELRMAAQLSGDQKFIDVFNKEGADIHTAVATEIFGDNSNESRRKAKAINFGILYGMGANALRKSLGSDEYTLAQARQYLEDYFDRFPTLAGYLEATKQFARDNGYTLTLFGRKRHFGEINSKLPFIRAAAERMAINAPIQGTATADIIKLALRDVDDYIETNDLRDDIHILAQVHDELVFEIKDAVVEKHSVEIKKIMENILEKYGPKVKAKPVVPLVVDTNTGANWAETK